MRNWCALRPGCKLLQECEPGPVKRQGSRQAAADTESLVAVHRNMSAAVVITPMQHDLMSCKYAGYTQLLCILSLRCHSTVAQLTSTYTERHKR
jgi:hypothetical protein